MIAEEERRMISTRTKAALQAAKALGGFRGHKIDSAATAVSLASRQARASECAAALAPTIGKLRDQGITSLAGLAKALTEAGIPAARGGPSWTASQVARVVGKLSGVRHGTAS